MQHNYKIFISIIKKGSGNLYFYNNYMSSLGIEPSTVINQFFYREPPLPIGSPAPLIKLKQKFKLIFFSGSAAQREA
jgi:hypothetical protein